jgi:hypothetical protein
MYHYDTLALELKITPRLYSGLSEVLQQFTEIMKNCDLISQEFPFFEFDPKRRHVKIQYNSFQLNVSRDQLYVEPGKVVQYPPWGTLIIHDTSFLKDEEFRITKIVLQNKLSVQCGFPTDFNLLDAKHSCFQTNINFGLPNQIMIYSNIVDYQFIGDTYAKVMKIVTLEQSSEVGKGISRCFDPIQYVKLSVTSFDTVSIDLRDVQGKFIPFIHGIFIITLHFISED